MPLPDPDAPHYLDEFGRPILGTFTASDGRRSAFRVYPTVGPARANILFLHGIQSHGGWYNRSCSQLRDAGFRVWFLDRRGAGRNSEGRGDAPPFRRLIDDPIEFLEELPRPRLLAAISWGGKIAIALPFRRPGLIDGLLLLSPGIYSQRGLSLRDRLRLMRLRLTRPTTMLPIPLNDPQLFTADPAHQHFIATDPLALREATARLMIESYRLDLYRDRAVRALRMPILLLLAERDRIIDNRRVQEYIKRSPSKDKTIGIYAGAEHTLEFEPPGSPWLSDLTTWLQRRF